MNKREVIDLADFLQREAPDLYRHLMGLLKHLDRSLRELVARRKEEAGTYDL